MAAKKTTKSKATKKTTTKPAKESKGPGVIATIQSLLTKATKANPLTKDQLLTGLVKQFGEDRKDAMLKTIHCQIPSRMSKEKGVTVHSTDTDNGKAFWIGK